LSSNSSNACIYFVSSVALLLEKLFSTDIERFGLWPIEKPSETICFGKESFGIIRGSRIGEDI
jgi:hypothetical protein